MLTPGATLGLLGGGQLGRMLAIPARRMGFRVIVLEPSPDSPAGQLADRQLTAAYDDPSALERLAQSCQAVTLEFENVPVGAVSWLESRLPVRPGSRALHISQHRLREKTFFQSLGIPTPRFWPITAPTALSDLHDFSGPGVLKTCRNGYDGRGQCRVSDQEAVVAAHRQLDGVDCVLEEWVPFKAELSVVAARDIHGQTQCFPVAENLHQGGILALSSCPAEVPLEVAATARDYACRLLDALDYVGVLALELFLLEDGRLLANEFAPRPHNSGHWSIEACSIDQFELQLLTTIGAPVRAVELLRPAATVNLLGDLWAAGAPPWEAVLSLPGTSLHLYGKQEARPGRKMGHLTALSDDPAEARALALTALERLRRKHLEATDG
jgi:5-(carboxyamino)imidazole ribonucleotide synthase